MSFIFLSPSPEEQTRIVAILDKFDALTNSITEGLPRENCPAPKAIRILPRSAVELPQV